jgi:VanZ family protein
VGEEPNQPKDQARAASPAQPARRAGGKLQTPSRFLLGFCTAALLTATHWPGLAIEGPIDRPDLVIHVLAFTVWAALLAMATGLRLPMLLVIGVLFAGFDEATQPLFNRVFDWWDLAADGMGLVLGSFALLVYQKYTKLSTVKSA